MWLFAGLGNPGDEYARNRHNIGFMAVDKIAAVYGFPDFKKKHKGLIAEGKIGKYKVVLLKPQTFMNISGESVASAVKFYKISEKRIVVFYDEIELPPGKLRVKVGGGNAGHNGLRSIDEHLPSTDYKRVRLGVGRPDHDNVSAHVLGNFSKSDKNWLEELFEAVSKNVDYLLDDNDAEFMNKVTLATKGK
jgi:peptidyl-tRNA hydrolase, PTH1 family